MNELEKARLAVVNANQAILDANDVIIQNLVAKNAVEQANQAVLAASETIQKLAAENAALKAFRPQPNGAAMMEALDAFFANEEYPEGAMSDAFEILCCKRVSTPATDAAIAEIKSEEAQNMYESILDNPSVYGMESLVDYLESYAENKKSFADNLRAGRKG